MERNQEPLPWLDRISEAVFDGQVELCSTEQAVEDVFQPGAIQVVELSLAIRDVSVVVVSVAKRLSRDFV